MSWLWDAFQQKQINETKIQSDEAQFDAKKALREIGQLEDKVDRLSLLCHALFEELEKHTGFSESQLKAKMVEIDLRDGKLDGKLSEIKQKNCPDCGHKVKSTRANCFWCGAKI